MGDGRLREQWNQTAHMLAAIANAAGGVNGKAVQPWELNPYQAMAAAEPNYRGTRDLGVLIAGNEDEMTVQVVT